MVLNIANKNEQNSTLQKIEPETPDFMVQSVLICCRKPICLKLNLKTLTPRFGSLTGMSICRALFTLSLLEF